MIKTFVCCELIKEIKDYQVKHVWSDEKAKYCFVEHVNKAVCKDVCSECKKWLDCQEKLQMELINAEIKKEKAEGKYYGPRNPKTYEGTVMEDFINKVRRKEKFLYE